MFAPRALCWVAWALLKYSGDCFLELNVVFQILLVHFAAFVHHEVLHVFYFLLVLRVVMAG